MRQFQQGDVIFKEISISDLSENLDKFETRADPVIQHGEHTGHAHRIRMFRHDALRDQSAHGASEAPSFQWKILLHKKTRARLLKTTEPIEIDHEEHKTITLPPGLYEIGIVREYDHFAEEARQVQD